MGALITPTASRLGPAAERVLGRLLAAEFTSVCVLAACAGDGTSTLVRALAARGGALGRSLRILDAGAEADSVASLPRDPRAMRDWFAKARGEADLLVIDAPPIIGWAGATPLPADLAAAADATLLVVAAGRTPGHLVEGAAEQLRAGGAILIGAVLNDRDNPALGDELCRATHRLNRLLPGQMGWLRRRIANSSLLNADV